MTATLEERFWSKVDVRGPDECWEWQAARFPAGYGRFRVGPRMEYAHRVSYQLNIGPISPGYEVCHHCDNPPCVNPRCLFAGTRAENVDDAVSKGRIASGERHGLRRHPEAVNPPRGERSGTAKLTTEQVLAIRARYARGGVTYAELGRSFGISTTQAGSIVRREKWAHV